MYLWHRPFLLPVGFLLPAAGLFLAVSLAAAEPVREAVLQAVATALAEDAPSRRQLVELETLSRDPDPETAMRAALLLARHARLQNDFDSGLARLQPYASPAGFDRLPPREAVAHLQCLLETAHLRALKNDIPGALQLLNWAESRPDDYHRAVACIKYAEILLGLNESERARSYLAILDEIVARHSALAVSGTAIGQGSEVMDRAAAWQALQAEAAQMQSEVEAVKLTEEYGEDYGLYVKLRRLQQLYRRAGESRYRKRALQLAEQLQRLAAGTPFAAFAEFVCCDLSAANLSENSSQEEISAAKSALEGYLKNNPEGLYKGEALMLRGKLALEVEWDAAEAEKYYLQALESFRDSRLRRDALSLYAPLSDDLKRQTEPDRPPTEFNQWYRIVYHEEDPLKLYSTANAPPWYIDDKEKECLYAAGFLLFANGRYDEAGRCWENILSLSPDMAAMNPLLPNIHTRLQKSCRLKAMGFWPEEKAKIKDKDTRLRLQYAEFLILLEKHAEAMAVFQRIADSGDDLTRAVAYIGLATAVDLEFKPGCKEISEGYCHWILEQKSLAKEPIYARALLMSGQMKTSRNDMEAEGLPYYQRYLKEFPNGRDYLTAQYHLGLCYAKLGQLDKAERIYQEVNPRNDGYGYILSMEIENNRKSKGKSK